MYQHCCPACGVMLVSPTKAITVCSECQERRLAELRVKEALYPSAESLGLEGSKGHNPQLYHRPNSSGRRIIRKSEPMGG